VSVRRPHRRLDAPSAALAVAALLAACGQGPGSPPRLDVRPQSAASEPQVVAVDPPNGATGVDPGRATLSATFDREMDPEGWAWVIENPATAPAIGESSWDPAIRVNTAKVRLEPGRAYVIWLNTPQFAYFRDRAGRAAVPFRWTFSTAGAPAPSAPPVPLARAGSPASPALPAAPAVVRLEPANGATDVDPATSVLRATFDRPMAEGWSWVLDSRESFPEMAGGASLSADGRSALLPVRLAPGRTYVVWLNSAEHRGFHDRNGVELAPVRWSFTTRPAR